MQRGFHLRAHGGAVDRIAGTCGRDLELRDRVAQPGVARLARSDALDTVEEGFEPALVVVDAHGSGPSRAQRVEAQPAAALGQVQPVGADADLDRGAQCRAEGGLEASRGLREREPADVEARDAGAGRGLRLRRRAGRAAGHEHEGHEGENGLEHESTLPAPDPAARLQVRRLTEHAKRSGEVNGSHAQRLKVPATGLRMGGGSAHPTPRWPHRALQHGSRSDAETAPNHPRRMQKRARVPGVVESAGSTVKQLALSLCLPCRRSRVRVPSSALSAPREN